MKKYDKKKRELAEKGKPVSMGVRNMERRREMKGRKNTHEILERHG